MLQRYSWYWTKIFQATDLTIILIIWVSLTHWRAGYTSFTLANNLLPIGLLALCWFLVTRLFALYQSKRLISLWEEIKVLTLIVLLYTMLIDTLASFYGLPMPHVLRFGLSIWFTVGTFHALLRIALRYLRARGFNQRRVVIYGTGPMAIQMAENLLTRPQVGMILVGFLEDELNPAGGNIQLGGAAIPLLGAGHDARRLMTEHNIHDVIIALPSSKYDRLKTFIMEISDLPVNVRVIPDLFDLISVQAHSEDVWDTPVIGIRQPCINGLDAFVKRTVDLLVSGAALLVSAPVMAIIALFIKLDSGSPILFRQQRIGLNGKPFTIYKFRTMVVDAEQRLDALIKLDALHQPMFKIHNDPRITRIGRILRKTSLDELPQLFNVFLGDMSLVGPRPEEMRIVSMYSYTQRQRLAVKPGLTGPMQVNGRGDLSFEDRLRLELNYIKNYSLYHDFELLIQTVPVVLLGRGAH